MDPNKPHALHLLTQNELSLFHPKCKLLQIHQKRIVASSLTSGHRPLEGIICERKSVNLLRRKEFISLCSATCSISILIQRQSD